MLLTFVGVYVGNNTEAKSKQHHPCGDTSWYNNTWISSLYFRSTGRRSSENYKLTG